MRATVIRPDELGTAERAAWRAMQRTDPAQRSPFFSPEFACAVDRVRTGARVAVLEDAGELVGFFAFELGRFGVGRPIGAGVADCQGLVHVPGWEWDARTLLRVAGLAVWEFDHLQAGQGPFAAYHTARRYSPVIELGGGYRAYVAGRRASARIRTVFRKGRKLDRELGEVRFEYDSRDPALLDQLMRWKSAQYRRTGRQDYMARPGIRRLIDELFEHRAEGCAGVLSVLWAGDQPVSVHLGLRSETALAYWFPTYAVEVAPYSPGLVLLLRMVEAAAERGLHHIDLGKGDEEYKQWFKTGDVGVAEGVVQRRTLAAALRGVQREPRRRVVEFVLRRPALRLAARRMLREVGRARGAVAAPVDRAPRLDTCIPVEPPQSGGR